MTSLSESSMVVLVKLLHLLAPYCKPYAEAEDAHIEFEDMWSIRNRNPWEKVKLVLRDFSMDKSPVTL